MQILSRTLFSSEHSVFHSIPTVKKLTTSDKDAEPIIHISIKQCPRNSSIELASVTLYLSPAEAESLAWDLISALHGQQDEKHAALAASK